MNDSRYAPSRYAPSSSVPPARRTRRILALVALGVVSGFCLVQGARSGLASYHTQQAHALLEAGHLEPAARALERARRWRPDHVRSGFLLARHALVANDLTRAGALFEELRTRDLVAVEALDALGRLAEQEGARARARALYAELRGHERGQVAGTLGAVRLGVLDSAATLPHAHHGPLPRWQPPARGVALLHLADDLGARGYGTPAAAESLARAVAAGVNWVSLQVSGHQQRVDTPHIEWPSPVAESETPAALRHAIEDAHALGLKVLLKPHVMLARLTPAEWRGTIGFDDPQERARWWRSYRDFILAQAQLAADTGVEMLAIGVELRRMVRESPDEWTRLIHDVREVYRGRLTYAANWYHEVGEVPFWRQLDLIGVQFFYPLATTRVPPNDGQLAAALDAVLADLRELGRFEDRPVLFTEIGYRSAAGALIEPWAWPSAGEPVDARVQAHAYATLLDRLGHTDWLEGVFWWNWLTEPRPGAGFAADFTPQDKPAEARLRAAWTAPR